MKSILRTVVLLAAFALMVPTAQADLIGHWTFDEGSGTTANDSSGNGYDGMISGARLLDRTCGKRCPSLRRY